MKPNSVYIIEWKNEKGKWEPTDCNFFTRQEGRDAVMDLSEPDRFRLRKYVSESALKH